MIADYDIAHLFLRRLGHPVALVGLKPLKYAPRSTVIWPQQQCDPADDACGLSLDYASVYANLNPLAPEILAANVIIGDGVSVRDSMIVRRTRILLDVDAHDGAKEVARTQKDAIKSLIGEPLIESDSGNGFGLIYPCDLPTDQQTTDKVKAYLANLTSRFPCLDKGVYTLGRLTRVIGTLNRCKVSSERIRTRLLNGN